MPPTLGIHSMPVLSNQAGRQAPHAPCYIVFCYKNKIKKYKTSRFDSKQLLAIVCTNCYSYGYGCGCGYWYFQKFQIRLLFFIEFGGHSLNAFLHGNRCWVMMAMAMSMALAMSMMSMIIVAAMLITAKRALAA